MAKRCEEVRDDSGKLVGYFVECPGCQAEDQSSGHIFYLKMNDGGPGWTFNGNFEKPTFSPSMLARTPTTRCHSFVTDGKIKYLDDCTHPLKGQTVDLPEIED